MLFTYFLYLVAVPKIIITVQRLIEFHNAHNSLREKIQTAQKQSELARGIKHQKIFSLRAQNCNILPINM